MKTKSVMTAAAAAMMGLTAWGGEFLFKDGRSDWQIVVPRLPDRREAYAAGELQATIKAISGAELPVVFTDTPPAGRAIVLGTQKSRIREAGAIVHQTGIANAAGDACAMKTKDGNLYLVANNSRAVMYSVYHFLKAELGARWFWPGEDGTWLPKLASYEMKDLAWRHEPSFRYRELSQCSYHGHLGTEYWMARQGLNVGSQNEATADLYIRRAGSHSIGIESRFFDQHPDWFALVEGQRRKDGVSGCWSNPGFRQAMVERCVRMARKAELLNVFPYDVCQRCQCADCTKIADRSSRWYEYYHSLISEVRKIYPDLRYAGIAYQEYAAVPERPVKDLDYVEYCQYDRCYIHRLGDATCPVNRKSLSVLKAWQKKATMGVYGYHFDIFDHGERMTPYWNMLADEVRTYAKMGIVRMKTEMPIARPKDAKREDLMHISQRFGYYLYAALCWDANLDVDALTADWCRHLFGAGAEPMQAYMRRFASAWDAQKGHVSYFGNRASGIATDLMTTALVDFAHARFDEAEAKVKAQPATAETARQLAELATERALFAQWEASWAEGKKNDFRYVVPRRPKGASFDDVPEAKVTSAKGRHMPTKMKMYAADDGLHVQVVAFEREMDKILRGEAGRDVPIFEADSVELFVGVGDGLYKQLGVDVAGGTYDANGQDASWNSDFTATTRVEKDRWVAEITLPFSSFPKPEKGGYWRLSVIRNVGGGRTEPCGFPAPVYRDLNLMAKVYFE